MSQQFNNIIEYIKRNIILPDFVESLADTKVKWYRNNDSAICNCPMSWHKDRNASFHMNKMDDNVWLWKCFGCNYQGDVIKFYMYYTGEEDFRNTINILAKKLNINSNSDLSAYEYNNSVKRVNKKKELENANIIVSNQCRLLLRRDFNKYKLWVSEAYKRMNKALDEENAEEIEKIGYEAQKKFV